MASSSEQAPSREPKIRSLLVAGAKVRSSPRAVQQSQNGRAWESFPGKPEL